MIDNSNLKRYKIDLLEWFESNYTVNLSYDEYIHIIIPLPDDELQLLEMDLDNLTFDITDEIEITGSDLILTFYP